MWTWMWLSLALAGPDSPFPRAEQDLSARYYHHVEGEGPVRAKWRRRWSPIRAWTFPDGVVQRYRVTEGRLLVEEHRFDATGRPLTTTRFTADAPAAITVFTPTGPVDFDLGGWTEGRVHRVLGLGPGEPEPEPDGLRWAGEDWTFRISMRSGPVDPFSDAFQEGLVSSCLCTPIDRTTAWVDGVRGVRYRVRHLDPDRPQLGEVWAVAVADAVLVAAFVTDRGEGGALQRLARGRALAALLRWEEEP